METAVVVIKGRTTILPVSLGFDVEGDTFTSQIREFADSSSDIIAEWDCTFDTDGSDGELVLTLDYEITEEIENTVGWMDLKRVSGGEPLAVFAEPLQVNFIESITV